MAKHTRRKKPTSPARAKPRVAGRPVAPVATAHAAPAAKAKPAKKRGRRRGLLSGLLTAARKFDPDQGVKFISYAVWWIRQAILAALARQGRTVRVPLNRTADLSRIVRTAEYLRQTLRREPTPEEIADATKLSLEVVQSLAALNTGDVRLDAPLDPDGDRSLIERFIAEDLPDTEDQAMDRFLSDEIEQALNTLQRRDAKVLRLYFGLDGGREHTLEEIGGMLGVTRERVRQLRDRALKRLRDGDVGKALASFAA